MSQERNLSASQRSSTSALLRPRSVRIALTSFLIENASWSRAASGDPDLSRDRYKRLVRLSNAIIKARPKPQYVVFPELAIPRKWIRPLAHHFLKEGISLITGVEYALETRGGGEHVRNEARLYLTDNRLGYPSFSVITQHKGVPSHQERSDLRSLFGRSFLPLVVKENEKQIYRHYGFCFGVLICSELTDLTHRQAMRGNVDNLFVLCWNRDLESFVSLVESSALDIHCFVTLVNNRMYGDSRVRAPYKESYRRDLVRIKGGTDDYFVITEINIDELREAQSHVEPSALTFKPTPEGFVIPRHRYRVPEVK